MRLYALPFKKIKFHQAKIMLNTQAIESCLSPRLKFAQSATTIHQVITFRKDIWKKLYPNIDILENDPFNKYAYIIYSDNAQNKINSTVSLIFDSVQGLPHNKLFPFVVNDYRKSGKKLMEVGRFVIEKEQNVLKDYYQAIYKISIKKNIDIILMIIQQKHISFYQRMIGIDILSEDIGENFGCNSSFMCVAWNIEKTKPKFLKWISSV